MKNILVFFGGESCEHDVSVITGVMALNCIDKTKYNAIPVFVAKNGEWYTDDKMKDVCYFKTLNFKKLKKVAILPYENLLYQVKKSKITNPIPIYCAVNCMHGGVGENGNLFALLKMAKIPCVSSDLFASSLAMDKEFTKIALKGIGVNCLPCIRLKRDGYYVRKNYSLQLIEKTFNFPLIVKPANLGSSIGIKVAKDGGELQKAIDYAFKYDYKIIVEPALTNFREINCAVYRADDKIIVSQLEEPSLRGEILTFDDKYNRPSEKSFPAKLDEKTTLHVRKTTAEIYRKLGFSGVVRIDFLLSGDKVFVNEINSVPGSLSFYLFCKDIRAFSQMINGLIASAVADFNAYSQSTFSFDCNLLDIKSLKK